MSNYIEQIENKRMRYLKGYILGFSAFMILMLVRHFFRLSGQNERLIGMIILAGLILSVIIQGLFVLLSALLEKDIRSDLRLKASLQNELVQSISRQSWIAAYLGTAGMTVFFAAAWFFYPLCDPVTIALCSIAMGAGAHRIHFYIRYKTI